jgi:hypothetical protein
MIVAGMKNGDMRSGHFKAADAAADVDAGALSLSGRDHEPGVAFREAGGFERKLRRRDGELDEPPHLFDLFFLDVGGWIEALHLAGNAALKALRIERGDGTDTVLSALDGRPDGFGADSNRSY